MMSHIPFPIVFFTAISSFMAFLLLYDGNERKSLINMLSPEIIYSKFILLLIRYSEKFKASQQRETSGWCQGNQSFTRKCHFKNLCYLANTNEFVFMVNKDSVFSGFDINSDENILQLSSVYDHNAFHFTFSSLLEHQVPEHDIIRIVKPVFIMKRFKLDNIMHIIHDDILPLYFTYEDMCFLDVKSCAEKLQLMLIDDYPAGSYYSLFRMLSKENPILRTNLVDSKLYCFSEAYLGLSKRSLWYQYGFLKPQSPIPTNLNYNDLNHFTNFIDNMKNKNCDNNSVLLFITRKRNRRIVNENDVIKLMKRTFENKFGGTYEVETINEEKTTFVEMFCKFKTAKLVVAMHGASLIMTAFLPPGSGLLELFPYAINASNITPYSTLSNIHGRNIFYQSWTNHDPSKTLAHPDAAAFLGGISHLDSDVQIEIKSSTNVPQVLCCNDPLYLYRMYQDTIVDLQSLRISMELLLTKIEDYREQSDVNNGLISSIKVGHVRSISCYQRPKDPHFYLEWYPPWAMTRLNITDFKYEIWVIDIDDEDGTATSTVTDKTTLKIFKNKPCADKYTWITVVSAYPSLTTWSKCLCKS